MITHKTGDIYTTELNAIAHGVNTEGLMGSGFAVSIKNKYPDVHSAYVYHCQHGDFKGGELLVVQAESDGKYIFNLASQEKPGANATYEFLRESVRNSLEYCSESGIEGLAIVKIGSDIGGLEWDKILPIMEEEAEKVPNVELEIWTYPTPPKNYWKLPSFSG